MFTKNWLKIGSVLVAAALLFGSAVNANAARSRSVTKTKTVVKTRGRQVNKVKQVNVQKVNKVVQVNKVVKQVNVVKTVAVHNQVRLVGHNAYNVNAARVFNQVYRAQTVNLAPIYNAQVAIAYPQPVQVQVTPVALVPETVTQAVAVPSATYGTCGTVGAIGVNHYQTQALAINPYVTQKVIQVQKIKTVGLPFGGY